MATCCSIHAWKTLWAEESGGLQSMGLQSRAQPSTHIYTQLYLYRNKHINAKYLATVEFKELDTTEGVALYFHTAYYYVGFKENGIDP